MENSRKENGGIVFVCVTQRGVSVEQKKIGTRRDDIIDFGTGTLSSNQQQKKKRYYAIQ